MEYKELKIKTESELQKMLNEERSQLTESRFKDSNRQLKNVRQLRASKKLVAMILTALNDLKKQTVK